MNKIPRITAHCIVKNEENFIWHAISSVIDHVDKMIIFDTGSKDKTVSIIENLAKKYPEKILFELKGECDKKRHTELRQEMLERTETDWFMILDGDEVWTDRGMKEAIEAINEKNNIECLIAPFYLCVGDVLHEHYKKGNFEIFGKRGFFFPRFIKRENVKWGGDYGVDTLYNKQGEIFFNKENSIFLKNKYWHLTHLQRSRIGDVYSSGGKRNDKIVPTYFIVGRRIEESLPEAFKGDVERLELLLIKSFLNFWPWALKKIIKSIRIMIKKIIKIFLDSKSQFIKYFIIGASGVTLDILTLFIFKEYFHFRPVIAVIVNQILLFNYIFFLNKYWSFNANGGTHKQVVRFFILAGFNYLFSIVWMLVLNEYFLVNYLIARVINIALAVSWNFALYKYWVYV